MKKAIAVFCSIVMILSLSACGKDNNTTPVDNGSSKAESVVSSTSSVTKDNDNKYTETTYVPDKSIYVNYLNTKRCDPIAYNMLIYNNNDTSISLVYDSSNPFSGSLNDVVDFLDEKFLGNIFSYSNYSVENSQIDVESSESVRINSFDAIKFIGKVPVGESVKLHVYGYSFVINDVPCMVVGLLSVGKPEQEQIDNLNIEIDEMVETIRTER